MQRENTLFAKLGSLNSDAQPKRFGTEICESEISHEYPLDSILCINV
jgi:hypothetical protein